MESESKLNEIKFRHKNERIQIQNELVRSFEITNLKSKLKFQPKIKIKFNLKAKLNGKPALRN